MKMLTCREAEKMVMPYIDYQLGEEELEAFLCHIRSCPNCREELGIYYTAYVGLRQLDSESAVFDIAEALEESLALAWTKVRTVRLRKVIGYAVNTLEITSVLVILLMQIRIWVLSGLF